MEEVKKGNMEAVNIVFGAIKTAIEKQIPQKPANLEVDGKSVSRAEYPRCWYTFPGIGVAMECYGEVERYEYCPECWQCIDREEVI